MLRVALFGAGRIGQVHARSIVESGEAELAWVCDPVEIRRPDPRRHVRRPLEPGARRRHRGRDRRRRPHRVVHGDPHRPAARLGPRRQEGAVREADRPRHGPHRRLLGRDRRQGAVRDARLQPALRSVVPRGPRARAGRRDRADPRPPRDEPRPAAAARRVPRRLGRHVPRHDHPRLRHGALLPRRDRGGPGPGVREQRSRVRRGQATMPRRSSRCATGTTRCA